MRVFALGKKTAEKKLGEFLMDNRLLSRENLGQALQLQKEKGILFIDAIIELGYATEQEIAQVLAVKGGFPYLPLSSYDIDTEAANLFPEASAKKYGVVLLDRLGTIATAVLCDPLDSEALGQIQKIVQLELRVFVSTRTEVTEAQKRVYKATERESKP